MLSTTVRDDARLVLQAIQDATPLLDILTAFANAQRRIEEKVLTFTTGVNDKHLQAANEIHSFFASNTSNLSGKSLRTIFRASNGLVDALSVHGGVGGAKEVSGLLQRFEELLDTYGTSHSIRDGALILKAADQLLNRLSAMKVDLEDLVDRLDTEVISDEEDIASIRLSGQYSLHEVAEKLVALDEVCNIVRNVLRPFHIAADYRVSKIETGSLSIEIIAQKLGILALKRVLVGGTAFIHRNYTAEGQLRYKLRDTTLALKEAIKLRNALAKEGADVDGIDEALVKQTELLVKRIGVLSGFEEEVRVNGEVQLRTDEAEMLELSYSTRDTPPQLGYDKNKNN